MTWHRIAFMFGGALLGFSAATLGGPVVGLSLAGACLLVIVVLWCLR